MISCAALDFMLRTAANMSSRRIAGAQSKAETADRKADLELHAIADERSRLGTRGGAWWGVVVEEPQDRLWLN